MTPNSRIPYLIALTFTNLLFLPLTALAQVGIENLSFEGSGCPAGSVRAVVAPDGSSLTVLYDRFEARVDNTMPSTKVKCKVKLDIKKPKHMSFAIESADFRGFLALSPQVRATQTVDIELGKGKIGEINATIGARAWTGPYNDNFLLRAVKPINELKYLSCLQPSKKAHIEIGSSISLENGGVGREGLMAVDTTDHLLVQKFNLKWINCVEVGIGLLKGFF